MAAEKKTIGWLTLVLGAALLLPAGLAAQQRTVVTGGFSVAQFRGAQPYAWYGQARWRARGPVRAERWRLQRAWMAYRWAVARFGPRSRQAHRALRRFQRELRRLHRHNRFRDRDRWGRWSRWY